MRDLYLPIALVEALGRATVARSQLELSFNIIVTTLAHEPDRLRASHARDPLGVKIDYLATISRSRLLKHEWWKRLRTIAAESQKLDERFVHAAMSTIYSRGGGFLEEMLRPLAEELKLQPPPLGMTPARIDELADEFRLLAIDAAKLAAVLLKAARKMSIIPEKA